MLPIETHQEALKQYSEGVLLKIIAYSVGMSESAVCALARRSGVPMRLDDNPMHVEIIRLHRLLYKPKYIAGRVGCTTRTIYNVIKKAG